MPLSPVRSMLLSMSIASMVPAAEAPPLKPGLWQITAEHTVNGKPVPSGAERRQYLRPEVRTRREAALKQRGVALPEDGNGPIRICLTRESMQRGQFQAQPEHGRCETTFSRQTAAGWQWHSVCSLPRVTGTVVADGEATFNNPENYQVKTSSTMQAMGRTTLSSTLMKAEWVAADCGEVKPLVPRGGQAAQGRQ
jgi:hypothetical protein